LAFIENAQRFFVKTLLERELIFFFALRMGEFGGRDDCCPAFNFLFCEAYR